MTDAVSQAQSATHSPPGQGAVVADGQRQPAIPGWFLPAFGTGAARPVVRLSVVGLVRRQWPWLVVVPLLFAVVALTYAQLAPRVYESSVLLAPVEESASAGLLGSLSGQLRGVAPLLGADLGGSGELKDRALAVMRSRAFTERFLAENELLPVLFADRWNSGRRTWDGDAPSADEAFEEFDRRVRFVSEDRKTGFVRVAMRARDAGKAAAWVTAFVSQLNERMRAQASEEARRNLEYLNRELAKTSIVGIQQALYRLIESEIRSDMMASVRAEYAFRVIDPATVSAPDRHVSPRRFLLVTLAFLAGMLLAVGISVWRELNREATA